MEKKVIGLCELSEINNNPSGKKNMESQLLEDLHSAALFKKKYHSENKNFYMLYTGHSLFLIT